MQFYLNAKCSQVCRQDLNLNISSSHVQLNVKVYMLSSFIEKQTESKHI